MSEGWLRRALTVNRAATAADAEEARLRGRTYAVPFERVWSEALRLTGGALRGWRIVEADELAGTIHAEATTPLLNSVADFEVRVVLDVDAQTRVDASSASRSPRGDLGASARRIARFFRHLDGALAAAPGAKPPAPVRLA